jgi:hypothetical protein
MGKIILVLRPKLSKSVAYFLIFIGLFHEFFPPFFIICIFRFLVFQKLHFQKYREKDSRFWGLDDRKYANTPLFLQIFRGLARKKKFLSPGKIKKQKKGTCENFHKIVGVKGHVARKLI